MEEAKFIYVTYIAAPKEKVWNALIDPEVTARYWQHINESDWKINSVWRHKRSDGKGIVDLVGKVIEFLPPSKIVLSWAFPADENNMEKYSRVTLTVESFRGISMLTVLHDQLEPGSNMLDGIIEGWPKVLASLKTLLETGEPLPVLW